MRVLNSSYSLGFASVEAVMQYENTETVLPSPNTPVLPCRDSHSVFCSIQPPVLGDSHVFHSSASKFRYPKADHTILLGHFLLLVKARWCKRKCHDQRTWNVVLCWLSVLLASVVEEIWHAVRNRIVNTLFCHRVLADGAVSRCTVNHILK